MRFYKHFDVAVSFNLLPDEIYLIVKLESFLPIVLNDINVVSNISKYLWCG